MIRKLKLKCVRHYVHSWKLHALICQLLFSIIYGSTTEILHIHSENEDNVPRASNITLKQVEKNKPTSIVKKSVHKKGLNFKL